MHTKKKKVNNLQRGNNNTYPERPISKVISSNSWFSNLVWFLSLLKAASHYLPYYKFLCGHIYQCHLFITHCAYSTVSWWNRDSTKGSFQPLGPKTKTEENKANPSLIYHEQANPSHVWRLLMITPIHLFYSGKTVQGFLIWHNSCSSKLAPV